ncbi:MAG TPA: glycosyltransferase [Lapillicoccus sp.]
MTETGPEENRARVVAVIPAYEPGPNLVDLVRCLSEQVTTVVVVDDGSPTRPDIPERAAVVVRHDSNRGIAAALNTGIREALTDADALAVLTVDQDSQLPARFVTRLLDTWRDADSAGVRVGLVAPQKVTGQPDQRPGRPPIQSGQLIPVTTLRRVGDFDERLFIDGVDDDYALRCLDAGLALVVAEGLTIGHRLGATHDVTIAGRTVTLTRSAPFRYYYLTRNRLWLVRRNARRHPRWAVAQAFGLLRHLVVVQTLVPDRRARADAVWRGVRDALRP